VFGGRGIAQAEVNRLGKLEWLFVPLALATSAFKMKVKETFPPIFVFVTTASAVPVATYVFMLCSDMRNWQEEWGVERKTV
jgi:hypothetical protein